MPVELKDFCKVPPSQLEAESAFYRSTLEASRKYRLALIRLPKTLKASSLATFSHENNTNAEGCVGVFDSNGVKYKVKKSVFGSEASLVMPDRHSSNSGDAGYTVLEPIPEVWYVEQAMSTPVATKEKLESFMAARPAGGVIQPQLIRELLERENSIRPVICDKDCREQQPVKKKHRKH